MKTAFKIPPETGTESLHLLIEVGAEGMAFVYYHGNPIQVEGLFIYQYDQPELSASFADDLKIFLQNEALPSFDKCSVCYNFKETTLVPNLYFDEAATSDILNLLYGTNSGTESFVQDVNGIQAKLLYRISQNMIAVLKHTIPNANYFHATALQLSFLKSDTPLLYAIIYQQHAKVFLFKNGEVQLQQSFHYSTPTDVAYFLLNVCEQHQVAADSMPLHLAGFIDQQSNLYDELYKYFMQIGFDHEYNEISVAESITKYPAHFFSHYFQMIPCVS